MHILYHIFLLYYNRLSIIANRLFIWRMANIPSLPVEQPTSSVEIPAVLEQQEVGERVASGKTKTPGTTTLPLPIVEEDVITQPILQEHVPSQQDIEHVLSDGLKELYEALPVEQQRQLKESGELLTVKIQELFVAAKATASSVLALVMAWLKSIPGVNRYYLEQEAKIKTDALLHLNDRS